MAILSLDQIKDKSNKDIFVTNWGQWLYLQVLIGKAPMIKWNKLVWFWTIVYAVILKDNATKTKIQSQVIVLETAKSGVREKKGTWLIMILLQNMI